MMRKLSVICMALILAGIFGACATVITGKAQQVTFESEPEGATVAISGRTIGKTPLTAMIKKEISQTVSFEMDGYKTQTRQLETVTEGWFWGNIVGVYFGPFSSTVDYVDRAMYHYSPSQYYVTLVPV